MGNLSYDRTISVDFDDRILAHLQVVIGMKLRRNEAFYMSWKDDQRVGDGRTTVWIHPAVPITFKYYGSHQPEINRLWIHQLELSANSNVGLQVLPEPANTPEPVPA